jgi:peptidoglycan/LPS O-acetylase OafA/YrhL
MNNQHQASYRPDIDGLRALAIISVVFFHAGFKYFCSGFIGVDIFFVISGYLITSIIGQSLKNNKFSLIEFYKRRIWRLQPAFIMFFISALVLSMIFLLPVDLIDFIKSARKTSVFISNIYFSQVLADYFSANSEMMPMLHTWSLSVEWQFYLLLPLVLYNIYKFISPRYQLIILNLLCVGFVTLAAYHSKTEPGLSYFQLSNRIFEFLIGAIASYISLPKHLYKNVIINALGLLALGILLAIFPVSLERLGYPNINALLPCFCVAYLLVLGQASPEHTVTRILSSKPLVFIGLISYSWYLWHWLFLAILHYRYQQASVLQSLSVIFISGIMAYISWRFIERPTKTFSQYSFQYAALLMVLPILLGYSMAYLINHHQGYPGRFNQELNQIYQGLAKYDAPKRNQCVFGKIVDFNHDCWVGSSLSHAKKAFVIGDSFSNHYWGFLDVLGKNAETAFLFQSVSSCLILPNIKLYDWSVHKGKVYEACEVLTAKYYQKIQEEHFDYVVIGQLWTNYYTTHIIEHINDPRSLELTKQRIAKALDQALEIISKSGATPVIMNSTAQMGNNIVQCFYRHIINHTKYQAQECITESDAHSEAYLWYHQLFRKMKQKYPDLILISPRLVQCNNGMCPADIDGIPVFRDSGHITDYASYRFGEQYLKRYKNPFLNKRLETVI